MIFAPPRSRQSHLWALALLLVALCFQLALAQTDDPTEGETDPVKLFERGQNAHAKGELARALALYEGAIKLQSEFPEAEYQRCVALMSLARPAEAGKPFTPAMDLSNH